MEKKNISYEEMSKGTRIAYEESEVPFHNPPFENDYEKSRPGSNGLDQSGMKGK